MQYHARVILDPVSVQTTVLLSLGNHPLFGIWNDKIQMGQYPLCVISAMYTFIVTDHHKTAELNDSSKAALLHFLNKQAW